MFFQASLNSRGDNRVCVRIFDVYALLSSYKGAVFGLLMHDDAHA